MQSELGCIVEVQKVDYCLDDFDFSLSFSQTLLKWGASESIPLKTLKLGVGIGGPTNWQSGKRSDYYPLTKRR